MSADLRARIAHRIASWLLASRVVVGDEAETVAKAWGAEIAADALAEVQPEVDAKDARIAELEAEVERMTAPVEVTFDWPQVSDEQLAKLERELKAARTAPQKVTVLPSEDWRKRAETAEAARLMQVAAAERWEAEAERAEAERDRLRAAVGRVRALHKPKPAKRVKPCGTHGPATVCSGCEVQEVTVCSHVGCHGWPCDTLAALDQALAAEQGQATLNREVDVQASGPKPESAAEQDGGVNADA